MGHFSITLSSPEATSDLARRFSARLSAGDVILLSGGIGAGKTAFCRALILDQLAQHGASEDVPSPTFTLVQTYETPAHDIWHADLYRLTSVHEADELGLTEAFQSAVCLVEWPDRLGDAAPEDALSLHFSVLSDNARQLVARWQHEKWDWLAAV